MSLITQCPSCSTMFKVVPDQLRVSDGWVRCGQCNEVFDANSNLKNDANATPTASSPDAKGKERSVEGRSAVAHAQASSADVRNVPAKSPAATVATVATAATREVSPPAQQRATQKSSDDGPGLVAQRDVPVGDAESNAHPIPAPSRASGDVPVHSFMRATASSARASGPWTRLALSVSCFLLGMLLMLQIVIQERDRIAAADPVTKRFLEPMCAVLNCSVAPVRQVESIVIDSSAFVKVRSDIYRLSFALKNNAQMPIATPDLELTLTDTQDQTVVRRVFSVKEFGKEQTAIDPGAELLVALPIAVKLRSSNERISGYRLLSFYQ